MEENHPCIDCEESNHCDHWEAMYCCVLCEWMGYADCEDCDQWDI